MDNSKVRVIYIKKTKEILFRITADYDRDNDFSEVGILDEDGFQSEMNTMEAGEDINYFQERIEKLDSDAYIELLEPRAIYEALVELALAKEKGE